MKLKKEIKKEISTMTPTFSLNGLTQNKFQWVTGNESVRDVLWNILLTSPGERLMRPEFGAGLKKFIHQPNNETTRRLIAEQAMKAIQRWEPRIQVMDLRVNTSAAALNEVTLRILYQIKQTGEQNSLQLGLQLQN
jgi:phage baseplate assembly protein W